MQYSNDLRAKRGLMTDDIRCYSLMTSKLLFIVVIISQKRAKHAAVVLSPVWVRL